MNFFRFVSFIILLIANIHCYEYIQLIENFVNSIDLENEDESFIICNNQGNFEYVSIDVESDLSAFEMHITLVLGIADFYDVILNNTLILDESQYSLFTFDKKIVIGIDSPLPYTRYTVRLVPLSCMIFTKLRYKDNVVTLSNYTNFEFVNIGEEKQFLFKVKYKNTIRTALFINAINCILDVNDVSDQRSFRGDLITLNYTTNKNEYSFSLKVSEMENKLDKVCKVMINVLDYMSIMIYNTINYVKISRHIIGFFPISRYVELFVSVDNPTGSVLLTQNDGRSFKNTVFTLARDVFKIPFSSDMTNQYVYLSGVNIRNDFMFENFISFFGGITVPIYFPVKRMVKDYLLPSTYKIFFTTIFDFEGYIVINQMHSFGTVCVKLKEIKFHIYNVQEIPDFNITFIISFYWNNIEKHTLLTFDFIISNPFFKELFEDELTEKDKMQIVNNVETYLKFNIKGLECNEGTIIKANIKDIWEFICDWKKLFAFVIENNKIELVYSSKEIQLGTTVDVVDMISRKNVSSMKVRKICISEKRMEIEFVSLDKMEGMFKRMITNMYVVKLGERCSYVRYRTMSMEYICLEVLLIIGAFVKRCIKYTMEYFNKENGSGF